MVHFKNIQDRILIKFSQKLSNGTNLEFIELETSYYALKLSENKLDKQNVNKEIKHILKQNNVLNKKFQRNQLLKK
jgi:molybdate-binding protein